MSLNESAEIIAHHRVVVNDGLYKCLNCGAIATGIGAFEMFPCREGNSK